MRNFGVLMLAILPCAFAAPLAVSLLKVIVGLYSANIGPHLQIRGSATGQPDNLVPVVSELLTTVDGLGQAAGGSTSSLKERGAIDSTLAAVESTLGQAAGGSTPSLKGRGVTNAITGLIGTILGGAGGLGGA